MIYKNILIYKNYTLTEIKKKNGNRTTAVL